MSLKCPRISFSLGTLENNGCWFKSRDGGILKVIKGCTTVLKGEKQENLYFLK